jgi:hypothetical protein
MKYLFLGFIPLPISELPPEESQWEQARLTYEDALQKRGYLSALLRLIPAGDGSLRVEGAKVAELRSSETQLSFVYLIEARDINEAARIALELPLVDGAAIEIHSILQFKGNQPYFPASGDL